jgi:hypothetical protein
VKLKEIAGLWLGGVGIFVLDLAFNGSSASDLFFPPQLRKVIPPPLKNVTLPPGPPAPPFLAGFLPPGQNIYLYLIGAAFLGVGMLILILINRKLPKDTR